MQVKEFEIKIDAFDIPEHFGIYQELVDHDKDIQTISCEPTIINDIDVHTAAGKEILNGLLITTYEGDTLPILPSCEGNHLRGQRYVGQVCPQCNTVVISATERPIESNVWIRAPEGVRGLINPVFWATMSRLLTINRVNILEWLVTTSYHPQNDNIFPLEVLRSEGYKRGLNNFYDNFDWLMELLLNGKTIRSIGPGLRNDIKQYIAEYRDRIFSQYLPIPNKLAIIMEQSPTGTYSSESANGSALDAVRSIASIYAPSLPVSQVKKENRTVMAIKQLSDYYALQFKESLGTKRGWNRKHAVGSRQDFSARAVISSITEPHHYEELHLPWGLSVSLFTVHLANILLKRGYTPNEIERRLHYAIMHYDVEIDEIFKKIIADSDDMGPAVILQRNPTLSSKSAQLLQVTKIKTDPKDITIGVSVLCLVSFNADFDGDALNLKLITDRYIRRMLEPMRPHYGVLDVGGPRKISENIKLPAPVLATLSNWLYSDY